MSEAGVGPTQGPWRWYWRSTDGKADCGVYAEAREGIAVSVCRAPQHEKRKQWEANARLIAAAPLMRDALREVMEWINDWDPGFIDDDEWQETLAKVNTALSAAEASTTEDGDVSE